MIQIEHLTVRYGDIRALTDVNLSIAPGEFVLVTGPSGCGKSTLARCLNGLIPHTVAASVAGRVVVNGRATVEASVAELAVSVGLVYQNPGTQLFSLTVNDEVAFGPRNLGLDPPEIACRVDRALKATGLADLQCREIRTLSGGEQQRLAIAAVLAMGSRILVFDEPTSSLDVTSTHDVLATLARLNHEGVTIIVIEHRLGAVAHLAQRTVLMDCGKIVADGTTDAVFAQRDLLRQLGLRRPNIEAQDDWDTLLAPNGHHTGEPIVALTGVEAAYGKSIILHGLDLALYPGEFVALVGDNGAGKSTLARILGGLIKPRHGTMHLGGERMLIPGCEVGLLFQNPLHQLFCDTVDEEVSFGPRNFGCFDPKAQQAILAATDLVRLRGHSVQQLSSGEQQRTALAAILSLQPRLIILDEPTLGQDWRHLSAFMDLLVQLNEAGCTILLITHDYKLVHRYARRIVLLQEGRIVADGTPIKSMKGVGTCDSQ